MRCLLVLLLLLCCIGYAGASVRITGFCPDPYLHDDADEYIVLSGNGPLDGISISDGKGGFRFPPGTVIDGDLTIAREGLAYRQSHGNAPDFEWLDTSPDIPDVIGGKPIRMANTNGSLLLYDGKTLIQSIAWPRDVKPREGQVHYLDGGVWDRRPLMLGQSRFAPAEFHNVTVTTFVSPDCSDELFSEVVSTASKEILLNVYEFSSPSMGASLARAHARGVNITMLVEGGPVGGIAKEESASLFSLNRSGIPVYAMMSTKDMHAPYRYDHAKYLVIDRRTVLLASENFKYSGFASPGTTGNRGWGVLIEDPGLAGYFSTVFTTDLSAPSTVSYTGTPGPLESPSPEKRPAAFSPIKFEGAVVRPVLAPDTSDQITGLIGSARQTVEIEEAYIKNETPLTLNPYLAEAVNASRRGVRVRVLLDSSWYDTEGPKDNDEMVALINRIGATEHIPLEARCANLRASRITTIHNKGVIVDDRQVLVSSINWNSNSPQFNREAGVIIDHPGVAQYFRAAFDQDWNPAVAPQEQKTDYTKLIAAGVLIVVLLAVWYRRHRT
jgi:phosphatidylserine/phosphatidylglycerophosphate/cardiolipin synthase-like enzyme